MVDFTAPTSEIICESEEDDPPPELNSKESNLGEIIEKSINDEIKQTDLDDIYCPLTEQTTRAYYVEQIVKNNLNAQFLNDPDLRYSDQIIADSLFADVIFEIASDPFERLSNGKNSFWAQ